MADPRTQTQPSIGELFGELTRETGTLIRQQMELARLELSQRVSRLGKGLTRVVIGGALATGGLLAIVAGIVLAVTAMGVPAWVSALVVGAVLALVGYLLAQQAITAMSREDLTPQATLETLKENAEWIKTPTRT
jgi:FAD/FMN-containing dehydrogenase